MVVFAILMLAASVSMIRRRKIQPEKKPPQKSYFIVIYGVLIGLVTGFLGA
jgi:uncharacterized membrane protein YfcA